MPPELKDVLLLAIMNPATLAVGYWLGRSSDQAQKIAIAAFVAAALGMIIGSFMKPSKLEQS